MQLAIPFPNFSPEIFSVALFGMEFALRWYALAYIVGLIIAWWMATRLVKRADIWPGAAPMTPDQVERFITWVIIGVILGGRLGFVLFYNLDFYLDNPAAILQVWNGGMAFHGGLLGVVVAGMIFCWRENIPMASAGDLMAIVTPPGLLLGRIANFINGELWGRPTDVPWGVIFPDPRSQVCEGVQGLCARHPSQLYEAALEGLLLGAVLLWLAYRRGGLKVPGQLMGLFFAGYGGARFFVEFFRQGDWQFVTPDNPNGAIFLGMTTGQLLSLPMLIFGLIAIAIARAQAQRVRA